MTNREKRIFNIAKEVASFSDFKGRLIMSFIISEGLAFSYNILYIPVTIGM